MHKPYHSKAEPDHLDLLKMEQNLPTTQKESKYYSTNYDTAIKKRLFEQEEKVTSTDYSHPQNPAGSLLNQLSDALHSYCPVFKDPLPKRSPNYQTTDLQLEKAVVQEIHQEQLPKWETVEQQPISKYDKYQTIRKTRISRVDRQITALYKQNRNVNLQYRTQKFMQLFLKPDQYCRP